MNLLTPTTLQGKYATLVPLSKEHAPALVEAAQDGELWKIWYASVPSPEEMVSDVERRLTWHQEGKMLPFTVIDNKTEQPIGMTSFWRVDLRNRRCDLGWTWYRKSAQRTVVNTECKLLLLTHAFEKLDGIAVILKANQFNLESRKAIERLGAKLDGVLRNFKIMPNGMICDFYEYSIIASEWPRVKKHLEYKLNQNYERS